VFTITSLKNGLLLKSTSTFKKGYAKRRAKFMVKGFEYVVKGFEYVVKGFENVVKGFEYVVK